MTIYHGDCIEVLKTLPDCSVDAVVTDPPYGFGDGKRAGFMGKQWDYGVPSEEIWRECLRVLKPGGHLLAFAGTRTQHRMAVRIEDAGFEIRDMIAWVYGSGFPKSLDVSKAIDKAAGAEREVVGMSAHRSGISAGNGAAGNGSTWDKVAAHVPITAPATDAARQWAGWGTALKPALEPITVARKPLDGTVAANVLEHGTGALNVDGCRVACADKSKFPAGTISATEAVFGGGAGRYADRARTEDANPQGRWPANLIHDGSDEVVGLFPETGPARAAQRGTGKGKSNAYGVYGGESTVRGHNDAGGSAARFFYCAKASKADRGEGNSHPTVKPTELMRYLVRLVTPPGGVVLDPFMGSGSTGKACALEGFAFIGIEREAEYVEIARARIAAVSPEPVTSVASVAPARRAPAPKPAPAGQLSLFDEI